MNCVYKILYATQLMENTNLKEYQYNFCETLLFEILKEGFRQMMGHILNLGLLLK